MDSLFWIENTVFRTHKRVLKQRPNNLIACMGRRCQTVGSARDVVEHSLLIGISAYWYYAMWIQAENAGHNVS